jgi:hypothetical protein
MVLVEDPVRGATKLKPPTPEPPTVRSGGGLFGSIPSAPFLDVVDAWLLNEYAETEDMLLHVSLSARSLSDCSLDSS